MGNTLEGQKALAPKPKKQKIVVTPGKPYYSSPELESGFKQTLPAATMSAQLRAKGPFGNLSPRAAALDLASELINLPRGEEGQVGHRHAGRLARLTSKKTKVY